MLYSARVGCSVIISHGRSSEMNQEICRREFSDPGNRVYYNICTLEWTSDNHEINDNFWHKARGKIPRVLDDASGLLLDEVFGGASLRMGDTLLNVGERKINTNSQIIFNRSVSTTIARWKLEQGNLEINIRSIETRPSIYCEFNMKVGDNIFNPISFNIDYAQVLAGEYEHSIKFLLTSQSGFALCEMEINTFFTPDEKRENVSSDHVEIRISKVRFDVVADLLDKMTLKSTIYQHELDWACFLLANPKQLSSLYEIHGAEFRRQLRGQ